MYSGAPQPCPRVQCTVHNSSYGKLKLLLAVLLAETADACQLVLLLATSIKHQVTGSTGEQKVVVPEPETVWHVLQRSIKP